MQNERPNVTLRMATIGNAPLARKQDVLNELDACTEADVDALDKLVEAGVSGDWRRAAIRRRISELTMNSRQESGDG